MYSKQILLYSLYYYMIQIYIHWRDCQFQVTLFRTKLLFLSVTGDKSKDEANESKDLDKTDVITVEDNGEDLPTKKVMFS